MLGDWRLRGGVQPRMWKRYIDDIKFLWTGSEAELMEFVKHLNSFHPTIKFKCKNGSNYNFETRSVDFLDTTMWIDQNGFIQTTLYTKPSRVVQYLLPSPSHPSHITKNIHYSLAYRLRRIESVEANFLENLHLLRSELISRKYRPAIIDAAIERVKSISRDSTLEKVKRPPNQRIVLSIPFDKRLPNISGVLKHRWQCLVDKDQAALDYLPKPPMVSYTRTPNIRDITVRSKVPPKHRALRPKAKGFKKCGKRADCALCLHSDNATSHFCSVQGETFPISSPITCTDPNIIYKVTCVKSTSTCLTTHPTYIGETGGTGRARCAQHLGTATQPCHSDTTKPVGRHFRLPGHVAHRDFRFLPIERIQSKDPFVRKVRESMWIKKCDTLKNSDVTVIEHGLNLDS